MPTHASIVRGIAGVGEFGEKNVSVGGCAVDVTTD